MSRFLQPAAVCALVLLPLGGAEAQGLLDVWDKFKKDVGEVTNAVTGAVGGKKTST